MLQMFNVTVSLAYRIVTLCSDDYSQGGFDLIAEKSKYLTRTVAWRNARYYEYDDKWTFPELKQKVRWFNVLCLYDAADNDMTLQFTKLLKEKVDT